MACALCVLVRVCVGSQRTTLGVFWALSPFSGDRVSSWSGTCWLARLTNKPITYHRFWLQVCATTPSRHVVSVPERQALYQLILHLPSQACDFVFPLKRNYCVALACLALVMWIRLALNLHQSCCLCLPSAKITGIHHDI